MPENGQDLSGESRFTTSWGCIGYRLKHGSPSDGSGGGLVACGGEVAMCKFGSGGFGGGGKGGSNTLIVVSIGRKTT